MTRVEIVIVAAVNGIRRRRDAPKAPIPPDLVFTADRRAIYRSERIRTRCRVADSAAIRSRLVPHLKHRTFQRHIVVQMTAPPASRASGSVHGRGVNAGLLMPISFSPPADRDLRARGAGVTAVLGPTNTGKTHLAIERMLAHSSGLIGLPLRLLAREVYNRAVERVGAEAVALITGEEKIKPPNPRFWVATVEAMPRDLDVAFLAIDEIQLAADFERGHVFTDRMLNRRGREETLVLGAATMKPIVERLLPGASIVSRPRLSQLTFSGEKKLTRLPRRSAIVAFSAEEVYAIAELIRRQRGGAAVVLGALSPRTRNAQVELYQSGQVDYLVATDAIGMGLNLDVDHIAFASDRKFDGYQFRKLSPVRARPDRRPCRPRHPRRHLRHQRPLPAVRDRTGPGARIAHFRAGEIGAMAQLRSRFLVGRRLASDARHAAHRNRTGTRAGGRRHSGARPCRARRQRARADAERPPTSSGCGTSASFPIIARSRPPITPSWW